MRDPQLLVFDNDGVLVDSEPLADAVLAALLRETGFGDAADRGIDRFLGSTMGRVRSVVEAESGRSLPADFEHRYHERLFERMETELVPVAGVEGALDALSDVPRCVASSGSRERIRRSLRRTGLLGRFDPAALFTAEDVPRGKPAPDLFLHVADVLGVAPARCVVVEDSPAGVAAAVAAGMTVIGFAARTPPERLDDADVVISSMDDLPGVLFAL